MTMKRSMTFLQKIAALAFSLALVAALIPAAALANTISPQEGNPNGTSGTCTWEIDESGKLTVRPTDGISGVLEWEGQAQWNGNPWVDDYAKRITSAVIEPGVKTGANVKDMFYFCENMTSVDLGGLDTGKAQDMTGMFNHCSSLKEVSMVGRHTENVTKMGSMFWGCSSLETIDLSGMNTAKVTNMSGMFMECSSLKTLILSSFDTSNVTTMSKMFLGCESLEELDLSNFKTKKVTDMQGMFEGCSELKSLDLSDFDTSKVTSQSGMFTDCTAIERITLGPKFEFIDDSAKLPNADWISSATGDAVSSGDMSAGDGPITFVKDKGDDPDAKPPVIDEENKPEPWEPGSSDGMEIKTDIDPDELVCVKVDGKVVDKDNYTIDEETGAITLKPEYLEKLGGGNHSIDFVTSTGTASTEFKVTGEPNKPGDGDQNKPGNSGNEGNNNGGTTYGHLMLRLYNPNSGEHFFTVSPVERDHLVYEGWRDEGIGWVAPTNGDPVFRLYNPIAGEHHYTLSSHERDMLVDAGWNDEGVGWYSDKGKKIALYRLYNPYEYANNHHYTTSEFERDHLISVGWRDEGVGWHGVSK